MAEKLKEKHIKYNGGEMHFGLEILLFIVAIFILWVLMGGAQKKVDDKPFITPLTDQVSPGKTYGPIKK